MARGGQVVLALGIAGALAACAPVDLTRLEGTHWRAVLVVNIVPPAGRAPTITFEDASMSGTLTCETFQARKVTIQPPHLRIENMLIAGQIQPCGDKQTQLMETAFFNALQRAEFIEVDRGRLVLKGAQGALVFEQVGAVLPLQ